MSELYPAKTNGTQHAQGKSPFILTICSGKGGVGKSFLAANLATSLSRRNTSVVLWDADRHFPNQHLLFGIEPPRRLSDVYAGRVSVDKILYPISPSLRLLADRQAPGFDPKDVAPHIVYVVKEMSQLTPPAGLIIIDTPAGVSDEVIQCCALADKIAIVITDEPTSLLDAYGLLKILLPYTSTDNFVLIVNNIIDAEDASEIAKKMNMVTEKFLKITIPMLGFIPYDRAVRQSIIRQEPLAVSFPESEAAVHMHHLTEALTRQIAAHKL
ncbi:MAG TPA: P-loop NTPase [Patescibacteria group bacterium]|nr:P-loop NTPase [Patescibacteria group bacterium]